MNNPHNVNEQMHEMLIDALSTAFPHLSVDQFLTLCWAAGIRPEEITGEDKAAA